MKTYRHFLLAFGVCGLLAVAAHAQDTFHNPAFEPEDEFTKAFNRARTLLRQNNFDEAIKEYTRAAKLKNDQCVECFSAIGQVQFGMHKFKDAAASYRRAAELKSPTQAEMYNAAGVALYLADDKSLLEEAATLLRRSIELSDGKVVKAYYNLGYTLIKAGKNEDGIAALKSYLEKNPNADEAEAVKAVIGNPRLATEHFAPAFRVTAATGEELSLDRLKGKVVVLDFWASWCGPCRAEMPAVISIWTKYHADNFVLIGINLDKNRAAFDRYVQEEGIKWPQFYDGQGWSNKIAKLYGVGAIPATYLIDQEGIVRAVGLRGERLSKKIGELLKKK